jgi:hypothetical protein
VSRGDTSLPFRFTLFNEFKPKLRDLVFSHHPQLLLLIVHIYEAQACSCSHRSLTPFNTSHVTFFSSVSIPSLILELRHGWTDSQSVDTPTGKSSIHCVQGSLYGSRPCTQRRTPRILQKILPTNISSWNQANSTRLCGCRTYCSSC